MTAKRVDNQTIRIIRVLNAPPARVFSLWTDPASIKVWFGGVETEVAAVELDLRPGGRYRIEVHTDQGASTISGEFLEVEPPVRLVYTWQLEGPQGTMPSTTVEVEFLEQAGQTQVVLSHGPFLQEEPKVLHRDGWRACFEGLVTLLDS